MTLSAYLITLRGRIREALVPELQVLRDQFRIERAKNDALSAQLRWTESEAREWKAIANVAIKRAREPSPATRRPLTDEEILKTVGWEIAEMYFKLTPGFPVAEARAETLKNARAIERAHKIGGNDE